MASRYATRPGRPSINSSARHSARNATDPSSGAGPSYQRRFRSDEPNEEEEAAATAFPMWKTIAVVAVVFGCFAAVYPKMFHPMLLYALGYGQTQKIDEDEVFPHPSMKHGAGSSRQPNFAGPNPQASRPGPHPGARGGPMPGMGPGMNPMGEQGGRGSKSIWHWMLPFYTVGVIIFLLYTLSKILWKKPKKDNTKRRVHVRYNAEKDRLETDEPEFDDEELDEDMEEEDEDGLNGGVMSSRQLVGLQRRLQDTEHTMHEILSQLEQLSSTADPNAAEHIKKMTLETLNNLGKLNVDRAASSSRRQDNGGLGFSGSKEGRSGVRFDATERRYLNDLQKALADFKMFTENYIEEYSQKQQEKPSGSGKPAEIGGPSGSKLDNGASDHDDVDVMEADKAISSDQLKVENGEGELISVEKHDQADAGEDELDVDEAGKKSKKHVRQRKGKKHVKHEE